jgi:hypothetical protein
MAFVFGRKLKDLESIYPKLFREITLYSEHLIQSSHIVRKHHLACDVANTSPLAGVSIDVVTSSVSGP